MIATDGARRVDLPNSLENLKITNTMGKRIAWARLRREFTQAELAKRVLKSRATIVQYEQDNIMPPIDVVVTLANLLKVSPEFLAFGREGVEGLKDGNEIVPVSEIVMGTSSEYVSTGYALPIKFLSDFDILDNKLKIYVLTHECQNFRLKARDRVIVATDVREPDRSHSMFLCRTSNGYDIIKFQPKINAASSVMTIITGDGTVDHVDVANLDIVGAITSSITRI